MQIDVGRIIGGKFRLVRLLGRGSMGEVWAAHHQSLGEHVALKLLTHDAEGEDVLEAPHTAKARFQFEAQVAARLSRKTRHIVRVTDHGYDEDVAYLVMELLDGETLEARLRREKILAPPDAVELVRQVARALAAAHQEGVAHRDLKPANVFLTRDEDGRLVAKLLDFGIARGLHAHRWRGVNGSFTTAKGLVFGTPSYMSPEQARGSASLDQRCDLWALATIAYEALTDELPVEGRDTDELLKNLCAGRITPVAQRTPALGERFGAFFARAFDESIEARFQTAAEVASAFARAAGVPDREISAPSFVESPRPAEEGPHRSKSPEEDGARAPTSTAGREVPRVRGPRRAALVIGGGAALLLALAIAWKALAPESPVAPSAGFPAPGAGAGGPPPTSAGAAPSATAALPTSLPSLPPGPPSVPVSALPRSPPTPSPAPGPAPSKASPSQPAPPPPPAPPPTPSTKKDRSEVF
jgi:serine/threonine protein kinase